MIKSKICTCCGIDKSFSSYPRDKYKKTGVKSRCKACEAEKARATRAKDPDRSRAISKKYREKHREKELARYTRYNKTNPHKRAAYEAKRRASKRQRTPKWLTESQLKEIDFFYSHARECTMLTGDPYHVDHIVPINGENVSGLHVPWNLQVLPADINIAKSNKF